MPAFYAHNRFGEKVAQKTDGELNEIISKYYVQFQIGLQGPDIFFFYRPWKSNRVSKYGYHLHEVSAASFFTHALTVVKEKGRDSREYAYLLGFICHYILDSECHPYVSEMMEALDVEHLEIEEEFERGKRSLLELYDDFGQFEKDLLETMETWKENSNDKPSIYVKYGYIVEGKTPSTKVLDVPKNEDTSHDYD